MQMFHRAMTTTSRAIFLFCEAAIRANQRRSQSLMPTRKGVLDGRPGSNEDKTEHGQRGHEFPLGGRVCTSRHLQCDLLHSSHGWPSSLRVGSGLSQKPKGEHKGKNYR